MKNLIKKELRENLKLGIPALAFLAYELFDLYERADTQLLTSANLLRPVSLVCCLFGLALGWCQIRSDRPRDLWAFLVHRPLSRNRIFLAKVAAGLGLYFVAAGLPLFVLAVVCAVPGRFASPFEWAMALPVAGQFLWGAVWYFAGMLTALRPVRWYASRGLGLVAALFIGIIAIDEPSHQWGFWKEYLVLAFGLAALAVASFGAFRGDGSDGSQPARGRRALTLSLTLGFVGVSLFAQSFLEAFLQDKLNPDLSYHEITHDGTIFKVTTRAGEPARSADLNGFPLVDPQTGTKVEPGKFWRLIAGSYPSSVDFGDQSEVRNMMRPATRFFCLWQTADHINWSWRRNGRVEGYDTMTRRLVGTIQPPDHSGTSGHFLRPQVELDADSDDNMGLQESSVFPLLATSNAVFAANLQDRTLRTLLTTADNDPIGAARSISRQDFIVVTRHFVRMMTTEGQTVFSAPYESANFRPLWVKVSRLARPKEYAVWIGSYSPVNRQNRVENRRYSRVLLVSGDEGVKTDVKLPPLNLKSSTISRWSWRTASAAFPPLPSLYWLLGWRATPWDQIGVSLGTAMLCVAGGWWLGRRYQMPLRSQVGWAVFHLFAGLPGFLAFLSAQDWPARVLCPNCKKMRVVGRARCTYCEAEFAPPEKTGTELFEPLEVS